MISGVYIQTVATAECELCVLTLKGIEDGKQVHEGKVDRAPGEESKAPGEAQEDGYPCNAAHVLQRGAVDEVVRVLPLYPTQLDQHHHEHDQVEQKNNAEVGDYRHVEGDVILQPAAVGEDGGQEGIRGLVICKFCFMNSVLWRVMQQQTHNSSVVPSSNLP